MQPRVKYLLIGLLATVLSWQVGGWAWSTLAEPFQSSSERLESLKKSVSTKQQSTLMLIKSTKMLKDWNASSLPPDPGKSKQPTAVNAQRLYLEWITDLAELCGFEDVKVHAGMTTLKAKVYISVSVKLDADARYEQLVQFLDLFYRTDLLHRVSAMRVTTKVYEGDPQLKVSLEAEGLALLDVPSRRTLFPETVLIGQLSEDDTSLQVLNAGDFPKDKEFLIKVKNELMKVRAANGDQWEVERGIERTPVGPHGEGTAVELVRLKSDKTRTLTEVREMLATNIFAKPAPNYRLKLGPLGEKTFALGKPVEFTIPATGYDSLLGKPNFKIIGEAPEGLKLDRNGKLTWRPGANVALGKYPVKFEVRHPSAPDGVLEETLTIKLRESIVAPKFADTKPPRIFLNREWKYTPKLVLPDTTSPAKLSWKLGDRPPKGITVDAKSGELKWLPGDDVPLGDLTIPLVVSDGETPPQSTNLPLKVTIEDDAAQFTRLTGTLSYGEKKRALLTDQSTDRKTELSEGDNFQISDLSGKIKSINGKYVIMSLGQKEVRWDVGQSLREAEERTKY